MYRPWAGPNGEPVLPAQLHWMDPIVLVTDTFAHFAVGLNGLMKAAANVTAYREAFAENAAMELEMLLGDDTDG